MRIIENNYKYDLAKDNEIEYVCESCNSVFQYNDDDIEFPKSIYEFGGNNIKSVDISNTEITTRIK